MNADSFGRTVDYLRISVTDRCDERCLYCMPEGYRGWVQRDDHMTADEIIRVAEAATRLGFRKFRVTGGEPLVRADIAEIARRLWDLPGVQTLGISTNGTRLASVAKDLKRAGVRSINVSLDALAPELYRRITGGRVESVLAGIDAALGAGFEVIKINCVLMRGINEGEVLPLTRYAAEREMPIRFIELMPVSRADVLDRSSFLSVQELMRRLEREGMLLPLPDFRPGHGPAKYYAYEPIGAKVGFIGALTTRGFCETCNKLRLTADGKLRPCLGRHGEIDLLGSLRAGQTDPAGPLLQAIANKPENHEFAACYEPGRPMTAIGG
ncbi:MAG TPA: GTP 3',8-cyclase MoaA [Verrucomicrobiae bacterium]|nr:GTP 3',8-cyclase MoaA [Verrucomicrobiae bacterium]